MKNYVYLVMLILGMMLTACDEEWRENREYGNDLTLENITVDGNVVHVTLSSKNVKTLYLDSVRAEKAVAEQTDTIHKVWNQINFSAARCEGFNIIYRNFKERKGNLRISEAVCQTDLILENLHIPILFRQDILSVVDSKGNENIRFPATGYETAIKVVDLTEEPTGYKYYLLDCHLLVTVTDGKVLVGTIDMMLHLYAQSGL